MLILARCTPKGTETARPNEAEVPAGEARGYDPLELPQDRDIVPQLRPQSGPISGRDQLIARDTVATDTAVSVTGGAPAVIDSANNQAFRVQLYTSKLFGEARRQLQVAEEIFDQPVYLDYEVPYFKVRVGNFPDREAAEAYQQKAKATGFSNAWVVLVTVNVQEASPLYEQGLTSPVIDSSAVPEDTTRPSPGPGQE
jgi:hypothetical protein